MKLLAAKYDDEESTIEFSLQIGSDIIHSIAKLHVVRKKSGLEDVFVSLLPQIVSYFEDDHEVIHQFGEILRQVRRSRKPLETPVELVDSQTQE